MRSTLIALTFAVGLIAGCMANGPATTAQTPAPTTGTVVSATAGRVGTPLILDRTDLRIGVTVQYDRIPNVSELADLRSMPGLAHIVVSLDAWPADYEAIQALTQLPEEGDCIVVLSGYPPSRGAAEAWNLLGRPLRIVVVVDGAPSSVRPVEDLNVMRSLERVVAHMDLPSRVGFERLQRPLSFRKLVP